MPASSDNTVRVRVKVDVGGVRVKPPIFHKLYSIDFPEPWPMDIPVTISGAVKSICANGGLTMGTPAAAAVVVRAQAYPDPNLDSTLDQYKNPPNGAPSDIPRADGTWSFNLFKNNMVPGAACDSTPGMTGGGNNSTLLVWYSFLGLDYWKIESTPFHGYCPPMSSGTSGGSGTSGSGGAGMMIADSSRVPVILHATFTGTLAPLGTVALTWNGSCWMGMSPFLDGALLAFRSHDASCTLLSAGPGTTFSVAGTPTNFTPFIWSGSGTAHGSGAGEFSVTLTE